MKSGNRPDDIFNENNTENNETANNSPEFQEEILSVRKQRNKNEEIPWVEKHRPKKLDDIIQQTEVVKVLKNTLKTGEMPHLLFFGPPGTGKTSTILAVATQLFGPTIINDRVIELNASDDRGIGIVRNNITTFARISIGSKDPKYPCPDFKLVILDEADAMTPEAQAALRKVMEKMSGITRFCFICNYINQIIDPISSRCMKFRFKPIDNISIIKKLKSIAVAESMELTDECFDTIVKLSDGDARRSIMTLQNLKYIINCKGEIEPKDIIQITGGVEKEKFKDFWSICAKGNVKSVRNLALKIKREGFPIRNILSYIHTCILENEMSDTIRSKISLELCTTDKRLMEGSDEYIQILNILLFINSVLTSGKK